MYPGHSSLPPHYTVFPPVFVFFADGLPRGCFRFDGVEIIDEHPRPLGGKFTHEAKPDAASGTGDQGDPSGKPAHASLLIAQFQPLPIATGLQKSNEELL
jgi:hypothetical protein